MQRARGLLVARSTLHVEKAGQRKILVGRDGARIRAIGTAARRRLETLLGCRVYLELFVRVTPRWKDIPRRLTELGYLQPGSAGRSAASSNSGRGGGGGPR